MNNELTKKENMEVADSSLFEGQSTGFEGTSAETFKTPFLKILQQLSPELNTDSSVYNADAKQGMFCNSATGELSTELEVVVLKIEHSLTVWQPNRGGFVGRHPKTDEKKIVFKQEGMKKYDDLGNDIIDTIEFYLMDAKNPSSVFIFPMTTASIKHGRSWATRLRMLKSNGTSVPTWGGIWKIGTVKESNDKGTWYTLGNTPEHLSFVTKDMRDNYILPALDMLKTAVTDYTVSGENEDTLKDDETTEF